MDSESPQSAPSAKAPSSMQSLAIPVSIVLAGALVAGAVYMSNSKATNQGTNSGGTQPQQAVNIKDVKVGPGDPYIGSPTAPVTLAYWSDYQCPFCKAVEVGGVAGIAVQPTIPDLITKYVDTGKLRIVFKDFPFLGNDSITGALYEHAVWDLYPKQFYQWREAMYKAQDQEGDQGFGNEATILKLIATIPGLDANKLKAQVASHKDAYTTDMNNDRDEGASFGVQGTPAFITGTQFIAGAESPSVFTDAIDAQLK